MSLKNVRPLAPCGTRNRETFNRLAAEQTAQVVAKMAAHYRNENPWINEAKQIIHDKGLEFDQLWIDGDQLGFTLKGKPVAMVIKQKYPRLLVGVADGNDDPVIDADNGWTPLN